MPNYTLQQIKDLVGDPIVFLTVYDPRTKQIVQFTDRDLPPQVLTAIVNWINQHWL